MFEKILYPTDFSDVSLHALRNCIPRLLPLGVRELHLIHVVDITVAEFEAFELEDIYREKLEGLARELETKGVKVNPIVRISIPSIEIAEVAEENDIDLVVIPSMGENIWRTMFVGSTASNLARATKRPVLLLKYLKSDDKFELSVDCTEIFKRPLVSLDFSKCSIRIIKIVKGFEELVDKGILLHSVDYGKVEELEHNIDVAKKNLEKSAKGIKAPFELEVLVGPASQAIIGTSLAKGATLIVIGKKGRSFIKDLLLGSTAERVIRDSKIPVLLVPCE
ncbi:universal stress protein [Thermococcus sp. GR7]|uniref:universal stress protein n=1 Tax=unclassified Thermococcus TaxID=2627626 RepID=UPI00143191AC|nr:MULTISPECIES: universal stress protein [unclassified Thermococcus]NJE46679.1 universal stress protein [Thermococcus sp. GR7]NJE77893.1 universal stress protein [Thermococcus sp. GR4]NJF23021.1 universal stress protein [Thermococcus sp. GR5]